MSDELLTSIMELSIGVLVFGIMMGAITTIADPHKQSQLYYAKDVANIMTTLYGLPGDVTFQYPNWVPNTKVVIENGQVLVRNIAENSGGRSFIYNFDSRFNSLEGSSFPGAVSFVKRGFNLWLGGSPDALYSIDITTIADITSQKIYVRTTGGSFIQIKQRVDALMVNEGMTLPGNAISSDFQIFIISSNDDTIAVYNGGNEDINNDLLSLKLATFLKRDLETNVFDSVILRNPPGNFGVFQCFSQESPCIILELPQDTQSTLYDDIADSIFNSLKDYYGNV